MTLNQNPQANQEAIPEANKLPVTHDKCPVCGSTAGLIQQTLDNLRNTGKIDKISFLEGCVLPVPLFDQAHPPKILSLLANSIKVPMITLSLEVCAEPDCGALYCKKFNVTEQEIPIQIQKQQIPPTHHDPRFRSR
jgi:hypothetical protein